MATLSSTCPRRMVGVERREMLALVKKMSPLERRIWDVISKRMNPKGHTIGSDYIEMTLTDPGAYVMVALEERYVNGTRRPFLRLVQIQVHQQSMGHGTRVLLALENIARVMHRCFMVECVNNDWWRIGYFDQQPRYIKEGGESRNYFILNDDANCFY